MAITTRTGKGSALTHAELDANFTELGLAHGDTDIELSVDSVTVTGNAATKTTVIGDETVGSSAFHGFTVDAGDTAWASVTLKEHTSTGLKNGVSQFANPQILSIVSGGSVASPAALDSGKRLIGVTGQGTLDASGTLPGHGQAQFRFETTETQSTTACGAKFVLQTSPDGRLAGTARTSTIEAQHDTVTIHTGGDGKITTGGDLILDDDVDVTGNLQVDGTLTVDGNATLGNANTDTITTTGKLVTSNGLTMTNITYSTATFLDTNSLVDTGGIAFLTSGGNRTNRPVYYDGSDWRYMSDDTVIASA